MKKLLSLFLIFFLATSNLFAGTLEIDWMEAYTTNALARAAYVTNGESVDQQHTTGAATGTLGDDTNVEYRQSQQFQLSATLTVSAVEVKQQSSTGTPAGNWTLRIETNNAGVPSGTLADANASIVVSPPGNGNVVKGTFDTSFTLNVSTTYHLVIQCDNQTTNNNWFITYNAPSDYAYGTMAYSTDGTWNEFNGDLYFKIYTTSLQSSSEGTIKTQGSYALKGVATTGALNKTLTKTFSTNHNLTGVKNLWFDARASRTGSNIKLGLHDTGGTTTEITPNIITVDTYQKVNWDFSAVSDANKDNLDTLTITVTNADAANTFYYDYAEIATCTDIFGFVN